jgi:predicted AAA+ superfamily ATPase
MITYKTLDMDGLWNKSESREFDAANKVCRHDINPITKRFDKDLIEMIIGPRQSGKTTLLFLLINRLLSDGIMPEQIFYLNLDTTIVLSQFDNPSIFLEKLIAQRKDNMRVYLILDEVQRLKTPGKFLKGIYDLKKNIKIFVSGSSSLEIRSKVKEFLTGRKRETHLLPLSFAEIIANEKQLTDTLQGVTLSRGTIDQWRRNESIFGAYLSRKMAEMSIYGGYPAVYLSENDEERREVLAEIYNSYIRKDVIDLMNIEKADIFIKLVQTLSSQVGNLINKSEICSLIGSNAVTITKFINILKETYITWYLPPHVSTKRNEIKSAHKCFFVDNGLRNFSLKLFTSLSNRPDKGAVLENLVFTELLKKKSISDALYFWRTKAGAEIDFVFQRNDNIIPIEIKSGSAIPGRYSRSFHSFLNRFSPEMAIYLNKDIFKIDKVGNTKVFSIPIHWFLLFGIEMLGDI